MKIFTKHYISFDCWCIVQTFQNLCYCYYNPFFGKKSTDKHIISVKNSMITIC